MSASGHFYYYGIAHAHSLGRLGDDGELPVFPHRVQVHGKGSELQVKHLQHRRRAGAELPAGLAHHVRRQQLHHALVQAAGHAGGAQRRLKRVRERQPTLPRVKASNAVRCSESNANLK